MALSSEDNAIFFLNNFSSVSRKRKMTFSLVYSPCGRVDSNFSRPERISYPVSSGDTEIREFRMPRFLAKIQSRRSVDIGGQPFETIDNKGRPLYALAVGEIYSCPSGNTSLSELPAFFCENGTRNWEHVNGQFCLVVYSPEKEKVHIVNDRFGFFASFYSIDQGRLIFSDRIKDVLPLLTDKDFSDSGIARLMMFGHQINDRTLFNNVYCLPPACAMTFDRHGLRLQSYWVPTFGTED